MKHRGIIIAMSAMAATAGFHDTSRPATYHAAFGSRGVERWFDRRADDGHGEQPHRARDPGQANVPRDG